ncbi:hypothetical protein BDB00DRAFT_839641 [Zychaea mexicana]|uniref:uncharacterized protein n=1 Tax=Zychaea mexicana TaxID=64656 RepID=UPI0022FE669C|nr:uncharacterized protein BDB00DRAFT_839641 [Zychaea mexicana]KAI9490103.1 hypothetical protein BDB00DRAFT_839641 [Zychaea mexicana]
MTDSLLPFRFPLHRSDNKVLRLLRICSPRRFFLILLCVGLAILVVSLIQPEYAMERIYTIMDFESEIDAPSWTSQYETERQSLYTPSMFIPEALEQNHYIPMAAVVDRVSKDEQAIYHIIKHLIKYPFIKEIYINNKLSRRPLSMELFQDLNFIRSKHDRLELHIIEPFNNSNDPSLARFTSCTLTTYSHCYFQDDLALNLYMDSQYTNFLDTPHLIHANARPATFVDHQRWRFQRGNDLHVGYAQFRYGAIVQKSLVESFISAATDQQQPGLGRHADINFIFWTNQYPWLLANPLTTTGPVDEFDHTNTIDPINNRKTVYRSMYDALRRLEQRLSIQSHEAANPPLIDRQVRASCANDHCLFTTNISPFDGVVDEHEFNTEKITSIPHWEAMYQEMDVPSLETWQTSAFHYAVDSHPRTCWNSYAHPRAGDYFGLNMVGTIPAKRILVHLRRPIEIGHNGSSGQEELFNVTVSEKKDQWVDCQASRIQDLETSHRIALHLDDCPDVKAWNAIRIVFARDLQDPIQICGLDIDNMHV